MRRLAVALAIVLAAGTARAAETCGGAVACELDGRRYFAQPPAGWDGVSPLPVLIHYHGWGRTGQQVLRNWRIAGPASANGLLLIAPDGLGKSWSFWSADSRDLAFTDAVLADAARHWPIDRARVLVSGFSYGAAMVWRLACARGPDFAAYLPIAGTLRGQDRIECPGGPARVVQVFGLRDNVMRLPTGPGGDADFAVSLWRRVNATAAEPVAVRRGRFECRVWAAEPPGRDVTLCLHRGGHMIPRGWLAAMLPRLLAEAGG